jgi:hypothetical protein
MDDVAVWDVMVDAANNGCVLTSEGVRLAIIAKDAELKRLREAVAEIKRELFDLKINRALAVIDRLHLKEG